MKLGIVREKKYSHPPPLSLSPVNCSISVNLLVVQGPRGKKPQHPREPEGGSPQWRETKPSLVDVWVQRSSGSCNQPQPQASQVCGSIHYCVVVLFFNLSYFVCLLPKSEIVTLQLKKYWPASHSSGCVLCTLIGFSFLSPTHVQTCHQ